LQTNINYNGHSTLDDWTQKFKHNGGWTYNVHMKHKLKLKIGQYMIEHNIGQWIYIKHPLQIWDTQKNKIEILKLVS